MEDVNVTKETTPETDIRALNETIERESAFVQLLLGEVNKNIVGQRIMLERLLIGVLTGGHVLLEGVPGLAKTLAIKSLAQAVEGSFSRIQFTPDLLPSDVVGTQIYNMKDHAFSVKKGPVFANFVLADEINRAPAKVQSALLEAMQERQVTLADETFALPDPFLVLATQNPVEQEGTYPLPEAQTDRFLLKCVITYPQWEEEQLILRSHLNGSGGGVRPVIRPEDLVRARKLVGSIYVDEKIERYILSLVFATRNPEQYRLGKLKPLIGFGASPRGTIALGLAARAHAFLRRRGYVIPEDVRAVALDVLRHRLGLTYEAEAENIKPEDIIQEILAQVEVP